MDDCKAIEGHDVPGAYTRATTSASAAPSRNPFDKAANEVKRLLAVLEGKDPQDGA
jgi:hypothetical protein